LGNAQSMSAQTQNVQERRHLERAATQMRLLGLGTVIHYQYSVVEGNSSDARLGFSLCLSLRLRLRLSASEW
jgi:hypothetical protein